MAHSIRRSPPALHWIGALLIAGCTARAAAPSPRDLADSLVLGSDWFEIAATPPLHACGAGRELVLHHSDELPLTRSAPGPAGALYNPVLDEYLQVDAELVSREGAVKRMTLGGISPGQLGLRPLGAHGDCRCEYTKLRLRSSSRLEVSKLEWRDATRR